MRHTHLLHVLLMAMLLFSGNVKAQHLRQHAPGELTPVKRLVTSRPREARPANRLLQGRSTSTDIRKAEDNGKTFYGYMAYSKEWTEDHYGLYSFVPTQSPVTFTKLPDGSDGPVAADGGGCYYDGKYYAVTYAGFMGMVLAEFSVYDAETWNMEKYVPASAGTVSVDMDFDPTTGYIYGAFYNDSFDGLVFGYLNPNTGQRTAICDLNRIFFAIAVNSKGEVYGLDEEGGLYRFNKITGERTFIGKTGILQQYLGGATFDHKTDELYWSVSREDGSWIYQVDTQTAVVTEVCKMPNNEEIQGMYIPVPAAEPGAPAVAENLNASFEGGATTGTFTFTMPTKTYDGSLLTGEIGYNVYVNDALKITGKAQAGAEVSEKISVILPNMYKLMVRPENEVGMAPAKFISVYIGNDLPAAVGNLTATEGSASNEVVLTWTAPETSLHGGYLDLNGLKYSVVRHHGDEALMLGMTSQLTYTDVIENAGVVSPYYYTVTSIVDGLRNGGEATSNSIGVGSALSLPYYNDFSDEHCMDIMTVIDRHGDDKTWRWDPTFQAARADYDWNNAKNEWLITPTLQMKAGRVYKLSFDTWGREGYVERFEVKMGQGKKHTDLKTSVVGRTDVRNDVPARNFTLLKVEADGDYNLGFHALSDVDQWWLYLDNISLEEGPLLGTPNAVTGLQLKSGEKGELNATISFLAPSIDVESQTLNELTGIKLLRNGALVTTLTAAPGERVSYVDTQAKQGTNHYTLIPLNGKGDGLEASDSVYVGVDIPKAPRNVTLRKVNEKPFLSWEAPTEGVNGGYVNPDEVAYYILRSDNAEVAERYEGLSITDEHLELGNEQAFLTYAVFAQNVAGIDAEQFGMSNEVCFGQPFELPFHESFAGVTIEQGPWTFDQIEGEPWLKIADSGTYPNTAPQDGDGGLVTFEPEAEGEQAVLWSSNISLIGAEKPQLTFWYYNNPGSFDKISARIRIDDDPSKLDEVAYINMTGTAGEEGWTKQTCSLTKYIGHRIQLGFYFTCNSDYYMHMDNISVSGLRKDLPYVNDLAGSREGQNVSLTWSEPQDEMGLGFIGYNVYRDGQLLNTDEPLIDPMYDDELTDDKEHLYQVTVVYEEGETTYSNTVNQNGISTGIAAVRTAGNGKRLFNLQGQRLSKAPKHATYITEGKKFINQ